MSPPLPVLRLVSTTATRIADGIRVLAATKACKQYKTEYKGKRFTIIDTPGLADNVKHEKNMEILEQIAMQLGAMGQECVSGVIYFHSIQSVRIGAADMANFRLLQAICGNDFPHVAFVTSRWDCIDASKYHEQYETINHDLELERRKLLPKGPRIFKFLNDGKSHIRVLDYFADKVDKTAGLTPPQLRFAEELRRYQYEKRLTKAVRQTEAGKRMIAESQKVSGGFGCCTIQ